MAGQMTSAKIARNRLLWCQHHDPVTRPSQKRLIAEFQSGGYHQAWWLGRGIVPTRPVMKRGKPVLSTYRRSFR